jgi:general secretion pathway protein G
MFPAGGFHSASHDRLDAKRRLRAFTLVELLIVITVLGILAALVVPHIARADDISRADTLAVNVRHIREVISLHSGRTGTPQSPQGYPAALDPAWFHGGHFPKHTWTGTWMIVETVAGAVNDVYPAVKTFNPNDPTAANAWYNTASGAFCVRVPPQADNARTLLMFNTANKCDASALAQTTP